MYINIYINVYILIYIHLYIHVYMYTYAQVVQQMAAMIHALQDCRSILINKGSEIAELKGIISRLEFERTETAGSSADPKQVELLCL